ncbi:MAG: hypothetical protein Q7W45_18650 [Bacteroidota bacterium]|nr:hypothetical protein [Bacteroidota bacterium]MDP3145663.1 hypothetical protein [Bacteroidota bacterium]MDP3558663.1 hypothetical protein [Bacteroidota bacterium]
MAKSKCCKCDGENFELAEYLPVNSKTKVVFIQCAGCGCVAGAVDQYDLGFFVKEIAKKLGVEIGLSS